TLTLEDDDGGTGSGQTSLTVYNIPPQLLNVYASGTTEGGAAGIGGYVNDNPADTITIKVNWGDGGTDTYQVSGGQYFGFSRPFPDDDPSGTPADVFPVSLLDIRDDDGGTAPSWSGTITITNVAPTARLVADADSVAPGTSVTVRFLDLQDPGLPDS